MIPASYENPLVHDLDHVLTHTHELWELARGKRIFVTGGTGFFGRWLLESFAWANSVLKLNAKVVVLSRDPSAFARRAPHLANDQSLEFVRGDVRELTASFVNTLGFDYVIHAATEASAKLNATDPLLMIDTIVEGTRAALDFSVATGARRFLLTSSGAIYGQQPSELTHIPESYNGGPDCTSADSAYAEAKRSAELLCGCYAKQYRLEPLIARCFAFVGPFLPLDVHFAIGNFIRDALGGGPIRVAGDGTPSRSYLYAADLTVWLWTILFKGVPMRPYNVGSGAARSIRMLAEAIRITVDPNLTIEIAQPPKPGAKATRYVPDVTRAEQELGLRQRVSLEEAISRTAEFVRVPGA